MGSGRGGATTTTTTATTTANSKSINNGVGGGAAAVGGGLQPIPSGSRKIVQSLKEIVNCPEPEIYAMLKECNMDPNEAVNRLLTQDPFHEVKSKREKKKENKDSSESWGRGSSAAPNRGRSGADRYAGRGSSTPYNSSGYFVTLQGRSTYKKENDSTPYANSLLTTSGTSANNLNRRPSSYSDATASEVKIPAVGLVDGITSISQPPSGYQSAWVGVPGQKSMADIVKMGKPQSKASSLPSTSQNICNHHVLASTPSQYNMHFSEDHTSKLSEENLESGVSSGQHVSIDDEWPSIEQPSATSVPSVSEIHGDSELHQDPSNLSFRQSQIDEVQKRDDGAIENHDSGHVASASVSNRKAQEEKSGGPHLFDNDLYRNRTTYQPNNHALEHEEVEDLSVPVSSVTANLQQLNIEEEDSGLPAEGNGPSVVIPDHLQVQSADCSHLSFGSFGSGIGASFSGRPLASLPVKTTLEHAPQEVDPSSVGHSDARNSEYHVDESLRNATEGNIFHRAGATTGSYDSSSAPQLEPLKVEDPEMEHGSQYAFPSSAPGYSFENSQQLNIGFSQAQTSSHMQNLAPFSNVMPAYTNSLSSSLLSTNAPGRESDLPYSPFPVTQSTVAKYGNSVSSITGPTISMTEALKTASFSSVQPTSQSISGTSVATGPALPQHLSHPYSQPTLPLGPFANMISYPIMAQSYAYMPSAFQQTFAGNSTYPHQSLAAAVLPQYKNSVSVSSLPQSAAVASGYGGFGSSTTIPGNFPMNPPAAPSGSNLSYDDVLNAQYKDSSHLLSLQQNDNSGMWVHGPGSRTMSALPASTYYSFQGQNQQSAGGFRQGHQPSQNYGTLGYPNYYQSQTGISLDQQQNPRDGSLGGSQGQPKQSQQQLWHNNY